MTRKAASRSTLPLTRVVRSLVKGSTRSPVSQVFGTHYNIDVASAANSLAVIDALPFRPSWVRFLVNPSRFARAMIGPGDSTWKQYYGWTTNANDTGCAFSQSFDMDAWMAGLKARGIQALPIFREGAPFYSRHGNKNISDLVTYTDSWSNDYVSQLAGINAIRSGYTLHSGYAQLDCAGKANGTVTPTVPFYQGTPLGNWEQQPAADTFLTYGSGNLWYDYAYTFCKRYSNVIAVEPGNEQNGFAWIGSMDPGRIGDSTATTSLANDELGARWHQIQLGALDANPGIIPIIGSLLTEGVWGNGNAQGITREWTKVQNLLPQLFRNRTDSRFNLHNLPKHINPNIHCYAAAGEDAAPTNPAHSMTRRVRLLTPGIAGQSLGIYNWAYMTGYEPDYVFITESGIPYAADGANGSDRYTLWPAYGDGGAVGNQSRYLRDMVEGGTHDLTYGGIMGLATTYGFKARYTWLHTLNTTGAPASDDGMIDLTGYVRPVAFEMARLQRKYART